MHTQSLKRAHGRRESSPTHHARTASGSGRLSAGHNAVGRPAGCPAEESRTSDGGIEANDQMLRLSLAGDAEPSFYQRLWHLDASGDRRVRRAGRHMSFYDQVNMLSHATRLPFAAAAELSEWEAS